MIDEWRLLLTDHRTAAWNMATDNVMTEEVSTGRSPPVIRFYGWEPSAVSIGYAQKLHEVVDMDACKSAGVDVVRRVTGGGAVFHDDEVTYSLVMKQDDACLPTDIVDSFEKICGGIIRGLDDAGVKASFEPINDVISVIDGRKLSGNAQIRRRGCLLQHGTILLGLDVPRMFSLLRVSEEKIRDKLISRVEERVTSVEAVLGHRVGFMEMIESLKKGFSDEFKIELKSSVLSADEKEKIECVAEEKFGSGKWLEKR